MISQILKLNDSKNKTQFKIIISQILKLNDSNGDNDNNSNDDKNKNN
jgi:hypothetical protein